MAQDEDLLTESFSARRKCFTTFQRITVVSNIIFALFALLLIVLGGVAVKNLNQNSFMAKVSIPAGLIVLGVILLFIIFLGVFGSFKKSTKLLAAYFVLLFMFIICEFAVGGASYTLRGQIPTTLDNSWAKIPDADRVQQQTYWGCCGWTQPYDNPGSNCLSYNKTDPSLTTGAVQPMTTGAATSTGGNSTRSTRFFERQSTANTTLLTYTNGCQSSIINFFQSELYAVGTVGIVFATLQLLALISSIVVFAFIKIEQRRSQDERF